MVCRKCGNPLRQVKGGYKPNADGTGLTFVSVLGCLNPDCTINMEEQDREERPQASFEG